MIKKLALLTVSISSVFAMHTAELNINQYDLEAGVKLDMGQFNTTIEPNTTFIGFNYLKADTEHDSIAGNSNIDELIDFNFMVKQKIENTDLTVGLGIKAVYTSNKFDKKYDYLSLPIGAEIMYKLPLDIPTPLKLKASANYAPSSLSFSDADGYLDYRFEMYLELMEKASVYLGYRNIETEYDTKYYHYNNDITYNKSTYFGIKFSF
ncbi:YfaZ family outer membrane protein [Sulfurimonas sp.]|uniref:YfaZ family outer membrane protein n=1 Tax=Sulfurimonas sp. TaxID=2022749 RepID=UPI00356AB440